MAQSIRVSLHDRVLTVTLDRADKRNALTHEMYTGLAEALERAETDPEVRAVILRWCPHSWQTSRWRERRRWYSGREHRWHRTHSLEALVRAATAVTSWAARCRSGARWRRRGTYTWTGTGR